jgi:hypothetical protein
MRFSSDPYAFVYGRRVSGNRSPTNGESQEVAPWPCRRFVVGGALATPIAALRQRGEARTMRFARYFLVAVAGLAITMLAAPKAEAVPVNYDFSVTATSGVLNGTTASGSFSYDTSSIKAGGGYQRAIGLLTALDFTWDGISYNSTTANTGALQFDAAGNLIGAMFGNNCIADSCTVSFGQEQWFVNAQNISGVDVFAFDYTVPSGGNFVGRGNVTLTKASAGVPEPSTLAILGFALAALAFVAALLGHNRVAIV